MKNYIESMNSDAMEKQRLLILTDIGGDPDDQQSMIQFMCYCNEFDIEGLIATSRLRHGHDVKPDLIQEIVSAYGQVHSNLLLHKSGYPTVAYLLDVIKSGQPVPDSIGAGYDTEASDWIITSVDKVDNRPMNIAIWGGATDLAQALWKVKNTRDIAQLNEFVMKLRVYSIGKQDIGIEWILKNAPDIYMILSDNPSDSAKSVYRGMYLGGDETLTSSDWINTNVKNNHGALGALYPMVTHTKPNPHKCMKAGDSPAWFYFFSGKLGISDPEHPNWGGWGGRFEYSSNNIWVDAIDTYDETTDSRVTVWRWRPEFQNDFAARMDWCVKSYQEANHNPVAVINGPSAITVAPETEVILDATESSDPDGNTLSYEWMYYKEAGTYGYDLTIHNPTGQIARFTAPAVPVVKTIHIILKVRDTGTPALFGYKRIIITVDPNGDDLS